MADTERGRPDVAETFFPRHDRSGTGSRRRLHPALKTFLTGAVIFSVVLYPAVFPRRGMASSFAGVPFELPPVVDAMPIEGPVRWRSLNYWLGMDIEYVGNTDEHAMRRWLAQLGDDESYDRIRKNQPVSRYRSPDLFPEEEGDYTFCLTVVGEPRRLVRVYYDFNRHFVYVASTIGAKRTGKATAEYAIVNGGYLLP